MFEGKIIKRLEERVSQLEVQIQNTGRLLWQFDQILFKVINHLPLSAKLTIEGVGMPATIQVGGTGAEAVFTEYDGANGTGNVAADGGPIAFASSNTAVATVDPASGAVSAVAPGSAVISGTDSVNGLTASDTVTVTAGVPQSATLVLTANPPAAAPAATAAA